jgi:hypothetical protein
VIGNVARGSLFSALQSTGAVGALGGPATLVCTATGVLGYAIYKKITAPTSAQRLQQDLIRLLSDDVLLAQFWVVIGCWR